MRPRSIDLPLVAVGLVCALLCCRQRAAAQCSSNASSCSTCHQAEAAELAPARAMEAWHHDHAFADLCQACHAGDATAAAKDEAHVGMRYPLLDPTAACGGCHTEDYSARAERYAGVAPPPAVRRSAPAASPKPPAPNLPAHDPVLTGTLIAMALLLAGALLAISRRLLPTFPHALWRTLSAPRWDAHAAGAGLGVWVAASELFWGKPLSASGAFDRLGAYLGRLLFPGDPYFRYVVRPAITWQVWLMVGVLIGSFASSRLSHPVRGRWLPDEQWSAELGDSRSLRLLVCFVGAALVQIGAGIAGGCTSGLAISGGVALSPAAFVFMAGMFAGGMPAAWLLYRGAREEH